VCDAVENALRAEVTPACAVSKQLLLSDYLVQSHFLNGEYGILLSY
jgi:hypothetical protein